MTWYRQISSWRDAECRSAALITGAGALAVLMTWLPEGCLPRCLLKTLTHVPCFTCGATRALNALQAGDTLVAFRLQPLATLLAIASGIWVVYAVAGSLFSLPRVRVQTTRHENLMLLAGAVFMALANWVYLIVDGR